MRGAHNHNVNVNVVSSRTVALLRNSTLFEELGEEELGVVAGYSDYY
jgi:hypothetical protein